jgi:hypothetical protein
VSTYWYYECLDHDPPIESHDEFTQHTDNDAFRHGIELAQDRPIREKDFEWHNASLEYFDNNARRFLRQHPTCRLGIISEYQERREIPAVKQEGAETDG